MHVKAQKFLVYIFWGIYETGAFIENFISVRNALAKTENAVFFAICLGNTVGVCYGGFIYFWHKKII